MANITLSWFHVLKALIEDGTWARMSGAAKALYPVIKCKCDFASGNAVPTYADLMELSGLQSESVRRGLVELEGLGVLRSEKSGRGKKYFVVERLAVRGNEVATFEYAPLKFKPACTEMKQYVASGTTPKDGFQFIQIEKVDELHVHNHLHIHLDHLDEKAELALQMMNDGMSMSEVLKHMKRDP